MLDSDDNFVEYGTPLEPLEEDEVPTKKPVSVADQIAVDDQGRRRFHGAFTGGFSAGYYNTVGSKEGWTPSDFKSSRQARAETITSRKTQNVQDFMDEEDMGAFGIAPQVMRATNDFEQKESRKRPRPGPESSGPIPGLPVLDQIIQPVKETIGIRILQRMGWKPGQGIGPRLSKAERNAERERRKEKIKKHINKPALKDENEPMVVETVSDQKVYGCFLPPELRKQTEGSDSDDSNITDVDNITFAPDDFDDPLCNPKDNIFGLGYSGLDRTALSFGPVDVFGGATGIKSRVENRKLNIRGEAFGVGAFEDEDEEVYSRSDMSQYDFSLETPEERKARRGKEKFAKDQRNAEKTEGGTLLGFVTAKNLQPKRKHFPPPTLPKEFEPKHYIRKSRFDKPLPGIADDGQKKKLGLDRHALSIQERQVLLGEEKIPLTQQEHEEIAIKAKDEEEEEKKHIALEKVERLKKFTDVLQAYSSNTSGKQSDTTRPAFKPFMKNPEKQERYEKYMTLIAAGFAECLKDLQPVEMTEWEREREKMEFERASALYKPITGVMSSRFVSAKSHDISHIVPTKEILQEKDATQDPKVAAKMNLFGKLTHKTHEWHPDRLLCKRFNVPHPYPDSKMVGVRREYSDPNVGSLAPETSGGSSERKITEPQPPPQLSQVASMKRSLFDNIDFSKPPPGLLPLQLQPTTSTSGEEGICPPGTEDEKPETSITSTNSDTLPEPIFVKPSIDLFKEIFENSSSSESEEDEPINPKTSNVRLHDAARNNRELLNPPRKSNRWDKEYTKERPTTEEGKTKGIFDNLDFSKLQQTLPSKPIHENQFQKSEIRMEDVVKTEKTVKEKIFDTTNKPSDDEDVYGPALPHSIPGQSSVSKDMNSKLQNPNFKSKLENPIKYFQRSTKPEDEGVMWVEKRDFSSPNSETRKLIQSSSKERQENKTHHHKKKLKERHRTSKSKSKSKKEKKRKESKHKKSKSKKDERKRGSEHDESRTGNEETEDSSNSSSDQDSSIQIHQSFNNKALLSKLKELTKSK